MSVLFADLAGFTTFSESRPPTEVLSMLNAFWAVVVPVIDSAGGVIEHFAGDGVMAMFNVSGDQPDHARRAARAALAILAAARPLAAAHPGWPIFRVGVNTGPAVVGDIGAAGRRQLCGDRRCDEHRGPADGRRRARSGRGRSGDVGGAGT